MLFFSIKGTMIDWLIVFAQLSGAWNRILKFETCLDSIQSIYPVLSKSIKYKL